MSLDFYLEGLEVESKCVCPNCDNEHKVQSKDILFSTNITHNLGKMADAAGVYYALWRPEEKGYVYAKEIIPILKEGLEKLKKDPKHYEQFNAKNGWGMYKHFVPFVQEVLDACEKYPNATISASR